MHRRIVNRVAQAYWRRTRGLTLGVQGVVVDAESRVLLVRHGYRPGWHFPGGGVEKRETAEEALRRELHEETGVELLATPQLHGVFSNFRAFPGDHILVYVIRAWHQPEVPPPNREIAEQGFFALPNLPEGTVRGARNRLDELFADRPREGVWA